MRAGQREHDGVFVSRFDLSQRRELVVVVREDIARSAGRVTFVHLAQERKHDRVRVERRTVVEQDIVAQMKRPDQTVDAGLPARRETGDDLGPALPKGLSPDWKVR